MFFEMAVCGIVKKVLKEQGDCGYVKLYVLIGITAETVMSLFNCNSSKFLEVVEQRGSMKRHLVVILHASFSFYMYSSFCSVTYTSLLLYFSWMIGLTQHSLCLIWSQLISCYRKKTAPKRRIIL
ncbi:hypothetical protein WUBG_09067 [Wuchereria bancrofti]|uniref:Uncharacterized protein n=1 Tax=Wuchereria bancrofti TaxID=6293 RepID=J9AZL0_WUCBA|nr:hypothetical protein WUBG_09067 [Wuchereria bancrofti]